MDVTIKKISQLQIDEILNLIGTFNQYQRVIYCLLCFVIFRGVFPVLGIILIGRDPGHVCNATFHDDNSTTTFVQETDPQCYMHGIHNSKNVTVPCPGPWNYNKSFTSIVTEWDLVCDRSYLVDLSSTVHMIGCVFGCLFLMPLGDKFGRRPVLFICLVSITILSIALAFSNFIWLFISLRFFIGALNMAISLISYCMISELLPSTHRTLPVIGASLIWSLGIMILALAGYLIKDWKILQIVISLPNLIVILLWWFLPESVTWLFLKENYKETIKIIKSAAKWNKKPLPSDLFYESLCSDPSEALNQRAPDSHCPKEDLQAFMTTDPAKHQHHAMPGSATLLPTETKKGSLLAVDGERSPLSTANGVSDISNGETFQINNCLANCETSSNDDGKPLSTDVVVSIKSLFATPRMLMYTLITYYLLMVVSLSYFGILLNTPALPGNIYMNLFFTSAVETVANVVVMCVVNRMGRRKPICCLLMISGISNLLALEVFYPGIKSRYILMLVWTMIGRFGITGSYNMLYLLLAEIFPTTVRNQAMGSASLFENLGSILAPLVILLAKNDTMVPLIIFGVLTLIGALLVLVLPETHLKPLPSSVKQVESW